ncbi:MAG TPA: AAA family ATPase [Patescibacteria group bacterium]|nr:AAA family ATPase [Patescibacteria group bacterium]
MEFLSSLNPGIVVFVIATIIFIIIYKKDSFKGGGSVLGMFTKELTQLAKSGKLDPVIGRKDEITRVIQILSRRSKNNPILIGKAGVGKTAIVEGLAQKIAAGQVPQELLDKKVYVLDISEMVSGTKYRGEFEERVKKLMQEITSANRSIILFVDEVHMLISAGGAEGAIKAEDIFKPALARGDLQMVGATTAGEFDKYIKSDVTLERRFQPVYVDEPNAKDTKEILMGSRAKFEKFHNVIIEDGAINAAISLSKIYLKDRNYPDKAIDLIDEACAKVKLENVDKKKIKTPRVTAKDVKDVIKYYKK